MTVAVLKVQLIADGKCKILHRHLFLERKENASIFANMSKVKVLFVLEARNETAFIPAGKKFQ